jgi:Tol biopolymer transport system component
MNPVSEHTKLFERAAARYEVPDLSTDALLRRRDRKRRNQRIRAGVLGLAIAIAVGWLWVNAIRSTPPVPADDRSEELGIFAPVAGRIVYVNDGNHLGYDRGLWAVDPSGPSDTTEGPSVADDVASALVRLGPGDMIPLGWSSDGTELLFKRTSEDLFPQEYLYILHADGSETQVTTEPMYFAEHSATIAPDGERVVFAAQGGLGGLYVVDAEGGRPVRLPYPSAGEGVNAPTFSPDGSQIAYLVSGDDEEQVWVADADGSDAHEILAHEHGRHGPGVSGLQWSPAGDRLAIGLGGYKGSDGLAIYTFAPDGSDFTQVITGGISPYWSPDGSQIAYEILCEEQPTASCPVGSILRSHFDVQPTRFGGRSAGLAIADADGSNVREFGFAASGPWHPGE